MKVFLHSEFTRGLADEWMLLLGRSNRYIIQQKSSWVKSYVRYFLRPDQYCFLAVRGETDRLICCLPLQKETKKFYKLFSYVRLRDLGSGVNDFFNIPCESGCEVGAATALANWFKTNASLWEHLSISFVPEQNILEKELVKELSVYFPVKVTKDRSYYRIDTARAWKEYFTPERNQKLRDVRGRMNRAIRNRYEVKSRIITQGITEYLESFFEHFTRRREEKNETNSYQNPAKVKLIHEVIRAYEPLGNVQLSVLEDQYGETWAYQLDLIDRDKGIWYHYAPTFNEKFREFSPSKLLLFESLQHAFRDPDIKEFNFMRGEAEYKQQFTDDRESYMRIDIMNNFSKKVKFQKLMGRLFPTRNQAA